MYLYIGRKSTKQFSGVKSMSNDKCLECGGAVRVDKSTVLPSDPPRYKGVCEECGVVNYPFTATHITVGTGTTESGVISTVRGDPVNHPKHYTQHPSGVECIQITEHMNFCLGNAIKYIWRASLKNGIEDLEKAKWYIEREISRQKKG